MYDFSTHILTRRMTLAKDGSDNCVCFSTHILTRRMTRTTMWSMIELTFQLTSSQGGWQYYFIKKARKYVFQLTSSQGGWRSFPVSGSGLLPFSTHILTRRMTDPHFPQIINPAFQLTSSQGGWQFFFIHVFFSYIFQLTSSQGGWQPPLLH